MTAVPIEKRAVSKARREKIIQAQDGVCKRAHCEAPATDVDHILPLWVGGTNRDDNLEGLCVDCHKRKTRAEAKARGKVNRIVARDTGTRRERTPIGGRGFGDRTRKFSGEVSLTKAAQRQADSGSDKLDGYAARQRGVDQ